MFRLCKLAIALILAAFIGLQFAAAWHSAEHVYEQHHCTLCLVKHQVATFSCAPALGAVAVLYTLSQRVRSKVVRRTAPVLRLCCRGPPAYI